MSGLNSISGLNKVNVETTKDGSESVFKPELEGRLGLGTQAAGHDAYAESQKVANLNLATCDTAKALGCEDVVVKYSVGSHKGQFGMFMEKAPGVSAAKFPRGKIEVKGDNERNRVKAQIARKLNRLQWLDVISGQGDRSSSNYFLHIDKESHEVTVKGIDNDASFVKKVLVSVFSFAALFLAAMAAHGALWPLQARIDELAAKGGGTLVLKPGIYETGALFFRPGVNLHLEKGATILGVDDAEGYPMRETRIEGETCVYYPALVNADGCDGFTISGEGVIDGHGLPTWKSFWEIRKAKPKMLNKDPSLVRPRLLYVSNSKNVDVSGVKFMNSKFWTTHFYRCENVRVHDCEIVAEVIDGVRGPSTDAIDIDVCRSFFVSNVVMDVNDDAVVVKGGKGREANDYAKFPGNGPSEGVVVEDCLFKSVCHSCLTLGSECPAVTNVVMRNCRLDGPGNFVNIKMRDDTPQDYSGILVENCRGNCRKILNCREWRQFSTVKRGEEPPFSRLSNFTMRGNAVSAREQSDAFDDRSFIRFSNCRLENGVAPCNGQSPRRN